MPRFTKSFVESLPLPNRATYYWDSDLKGFGLRINPGGRRTYIAQGSRRGTSHRVTIGVHGVWTVEQARQKARAILFQLGEGKDPRAPEAAKLTFGQALDLYLRGHGRQPSTESQYRRQARYHFADWLDKPLVEIDRPAARKRHEKITASGGPYAANTAMRIFRAVWNRALREHPELPICPTINVDWNVERPRRNGLGIAELAAYWKRLDAIPNATIADFYRFVLLTGQRRAAVQSIRWENVDLERGVVHFPSPKGGEKRAFDLPLSAAALALLRRRREATNSPWAFPGNSHAGHLTDPTIDGLPGPHALRHTWASAANAASISPYHIKLLLNHALPRGDVTAGYIAPDLEGLRASAEQVVAYLSRHINAPLS